MTTPEGNTIEPNVRANNNIVWRNLQVIDLGGDDSSVDAWLEVPGAGKGQSFVVEIRPVPSWRSGRSHGPHFLDFGRVTLTLDERLTEAWREVAFEGKGLRREGNVVTITSHEGAQLKFNGMDATARARISFSRVRDSSYPRDKFSWRVIMFPTDDSKPRATGGITYEVRTTAP